MKKLKDILYDYNDILIAFAILAIAAALIVWRISAIAEYPKEFIDSSDTQTSEPAGDEGENGSASDEPAGEGNDQEPTGTDDDDQGNSNESEGNDQGDGDNSSVGNSGSLWSNGVLTRDVEVSVSGDSASAAIQKLIDAGLFDDYSEYQTACDNLGIDHQKVSAGTFVFEKGSTKSDIAHIVNWS